MVFTSRKVFLHQGIWFILSSLMTSPLSLLPSDSLPSLPKQNNQKPSGKSKASYIPGYLKLHRTGELRQRGQALWDIMKKCQLCPRLCGVNRIEGQKGFCNASAKLKISSYHPHFGEERPLVGKDGSGTIFFSHCGLRCVFCINWQISHEGQGYFESIETLSGMMLHLQNRGCPNINLVTPTHYSPHIILALDMAIEKGLYIPIVYNSCGWERIEIIELLEGIVDIYLPDFKYADPEMAALYSANARTYPEITKRALLEMNRQVGIAKPGPKDIMYKGLMIRHLVMPNKISNSIEIMKWIAENLPNDTYVNIMSQYKPSYMAYDYPDISRRLNHKEYTDVVNAAKSYGLTNLNIQGFK